MTAIIWNFLIGNKIARTIGMVVMAVLGVLTFGAVKKREGARDAKRKAAEARADTIEKAEKIEDAVDAKTDAAVRGDLGRWVRPD